MTPEEIQETLAPPGAGLPGFQAFLLRRILFPTICRFTSWEKAGTVFETEGAKLIALAQPLLPDLFQKRVLVKPLWGIEDSSRYWSAEMVLEHLIEVGSRIAIGIVELSHGEQPTVAADIVDVEPNGGHGTRLLEDYKVFLGDYVKTLSEDVGDKRSKLTHPHPWFGQLTAHRWACLGTVHQTRHRRQMEEIVAQLRS